MDLSAILTDNVCRAPLTARHCLWPLARLRPEDIDSRPDFRRCPPPASDRAADHGCTSIECRAELS